MASSPASGATRPVPTAHTLPMQNLVNRIARALLRVPGLSRLIGRRLVVIDVVGRRSGKRYRVPVAYMRHGADLLVGTPFGWGRNLRTGEPVQILLKGRRLSAAVEVIADEAGVVDLYGLMARDNHQFASFNGISLDRAGEPDPADLHRAFAGGARVFRLTPQSAAGGSTS